MKGKDYGLFVVDPRGSVVEFRRVRGQSPPVLKTAPQAVPVRAS
jgi:hypothetical protein